MATKEQYDFFKDQYLDEEKRYSDITKRAEIYFSILSVFITGILFKLKDMFDLFEKSNEYYKVTGSSLFIVTFCFLGVGFYFITKALRIKTYQSVIDFEKYRDDLGDTPTANEDFFDDRIIDYMYATEKNENVNEERAIDLTKALRYIFAGFISIFVFVIVLIIQRI